MDGGHITAGDSQPQGSVHVHRSHAAHRDRIRDIRPGDPTDDREVQLAPRVNRVLPIGRTHLTDLWTAFDD